MFYRNNKCLFKMMLAVMLCIVMSGTCVKVMAEGSVQIASECDLSDLEIPISSTVENVPVGQVLDIKAKSAILLEPNTGEILYEMNADEVLPPASITKIMPLLLIMEAIDRKEMALEDVITASEHACSMGGSQIWLEPGETMTVDDLLKATVIASANDATVALGETLAGSEEGFVAQMNERAQELGMNSTHFANCTGLDAEGHVTTAHDVALMAAELIKHDLIKKYSTVWMDTLRNGKSELVNTNKLVRFYKGTTGLKTGTTSSAGYCLCATAERNGLELVAVIMAGDSSSDRFEGAKKLLDYGFANYSFTSVEPDIDKNMIIKVEDGTEQQVGVGAEENFSMLLKKADTSKISQKLTMEESVKAPVKKGDVVGTVDIFLGDEAVGSIEVKAQSDVPRLTFWVVFIRLLSGVFMP